MSIYDLNAYEVLQTEDLSDLKSKGTLLKHKKSGARVLLMENDDENKVFTIGFRTPPSDSTGVPHIMEHSVLCGSTGTPFLSGFRAFRSTSGSQRRPSDTPQVQAALPEHGIFQ